ncbi:MAG TPA: phytanoyl-CoA dioxygenase family protein [Polyangiaceae bacterium]
MSIDSRFREIARATVRTQEIAPGALNSAAVEAAVRAVQHSGLVVLEGAVTAESINALRHKMTEDLPAFLARNRRPFNWNPGNLQQAPPRALPYLLRDVLVNDSVIAVTSALLGAGVRSVYYEGNTAMPRSTQRQPVHTDQTQLWRGLEHAPPANALVINVPLCDVGPENGGTELWLGSHLETGLTWGDPLDVPTDLQERRRAFAPPVRLQARAGDVLIRDIRLWHAGMPNGTDEPRFLIAMIHTAGWWRFPGMEPLKFPKGAEGLLSHPVLTTHVEFVDEPIDHVQLTEGHKYQD